MEPLRPDGIELMGLAQVRQSEGVGAFFEGRQALICWGLHLAAALQAL